MEMDFTAKLGKARIIMFQAMLESYLVLNNKGTLEEILEDEGFEYGIITDKQYALLHFFLVDEYKHYGLNLTEEIQKSGEEVVPGKLSKFG